MKNLTLNKLKSNKLKTLVASFLMCLSALCFAVDLQDAKDKGLVGETPSGYLESVDGKPTKDVVALIADINAKRKVKYEEVAAKVGKSLTIIEKLAGEKAFEKTEAGHYIQLPSGEWVKK